MRIDTQPESLDRLIRIAAVTAGESCSGYVSRIMSGVLGHGDAADTPDLPVPPPEPAPEECESP